MKITKHTGNLMMLSITVFWGLGFPVTQLAINAGLGVGMVNILRGAIFTVLTAAFFFKKIFTYTKKEFVVCFVAGGVNAVAFILQTLALEYTTPSNSAFLTVTYVLMVPLIAWIFMKKRPTVKLFFCILICLVGMALLTGLIGARVTANIGDLFALLCALFYAISILILANGTREIHFSKVSFAFGFMQLIGGALYFLIFKETVSNVNVTAAILPILYLGVISSFVSQSLQVIGQQHTSADAAALIMTLEGFFGGIFSVLFGFDKLTWQFAVGGLLVAVSLVLYEAPIEKLLRRKKPVTEDKFNE